MNPLEKVDMETASYGACGNNEVAKGFFRLGWIAARDHERNPNKTTAYKYGKNLPVSPTVLTKIELVSAMALQGMLAGGKYHGKDNTTIGQEAILQAQKLLELLGS